MAIAEHHPSDGELAAHVRTYRDFVKLTAFFVAHVVVVLALLAYFLV